MSSPIQSSSSEISFHEAEEITYNGKLTELKNREVRAFETLHFPQLNALCNRRVYECKTWAHAKKSDSSQVSSFHQRHKLIQRYSQFQLNKDWDFERCETQALTLKQVEEELSYLDPREDIDIRIFMTAKYNHHTNCKCSFGVGKAKNEKNPIAQRTTIVGRYTNVNNAAERYLKAQQEKRWILQSSNWCQL